LVFGVLQCVCCHAEQIMCHLNVFRSHVFKDLTPYHEDGCIHDGFRSEPVVKPVLPTENVVL